MTNYDKIQNLDIEDLADLLTELNTNVDDIVCIKCPVKYQKECPSKTECVFKDKYTILVWLTMECD